MEKTDEAMNYQSNPAPSTVIYVTSTRASSQQCYTNPYSYSYPQSPHTYPPPPPSPPPPRPPPIMGQQTSGWRNKPQTDATAAGGFIFLSAGINLALGVGWSELSFFGQSLQNFRLAWFVAVIIGTTFSMSLRYLISQRIITAFSSALIVIGGIIYTCEPMNGDSLLAGRYMNGIAVGLVIAPFLKYASEIATDSYRSLCLATEQYSMTCGIALQMILTSSWSPIIDFPVNRLHGIFDILFGCCAAACLKNVIDSPIELIRRGNNSAALESLAFLQRPGDVTTETVALLEQRKAYVREETNLSIIGNMRHGVLPLIKMILFRSIMLAFCCSLPLNTGFHYSMEVERVEWAPWVAGTLRMIGALIALLCIDRMGRKLPSLVAMAVIGCLSVLHAIHFHSTYPDADWAKAKHLYLAIQFFAGFFAPYASLYIGEAFPLKLKPFLMDICIIAEQLCHIILITTIQINLIDNLAVQGGIVIGAFVVLAFMLPETRNTSLTEAQRRFRKFFYIKFN